MTHPIHIFFSMMGISSLSFTAYDLCWSVSTFPQMKVRKWRFPIKEGRKFYSWSICQMKRGLVSCYANHCKNVSSIIAYKIPVLSTIKLHSLSITVSLASSMSSLQKVCCGIVASSNWWVLFYRYAIFTTAYLCVLALQRSCTH